ncbi:MAG: type IX secretion system outer membrane channel protein PorV [Bacteroidales bacterium]|nr:type IX secretion system outer membrane channel protein PorV [Bacteroidales bacterium]
MKLKIIIVSILFLGFMQMQGQPINGQDSNADHINVITTAVPFLMIAPDARAGSMGDAGVSTKADVYSMHWNPAKYAVMESDMSVGLSYSPWLRNLVPDMNLAYLAFAKRIDNMSTFAATLRYFTLGSIQFTNDQGIEIGNYDPNEWAVDATYSRKLTDNLSGAVSGRFIYSNLTQGQDVQSIETSAGWSIASDVAVFWQKDVNWFPDISSNFAWGINISNIGAKVGYSQFTIKKDFIPTNLRFGPTLTLDIDDYNTIAFSIDVNKLLVPSPPIYLRDSLGPVLIEGTDEYVIDKGMTDDVSVVKGMVQSFYDAPGGFGEEMRELSFSVATEYWYNKVFALRGGMFYEDASKGNRKFFTLGAGLHYNVFALDFSYLIPVNSGNSTGTNPLQNTLRFALTFDLAEMGNKE